MCKDSDILKIRDTYLRLVLMASCVFDTPAQPVNTHFGGVVSPQVGNEALFLYSDVPSNDRNRNRSFNGEINQTILQSRPRRFHMREI